MTRRTAAPDAEHQGGRLAVFAGLLIGLPVALGLWLVIVLVIVKSALHLAQPR